jgi:TRAP-type C4-dicarboxylate transport system permease large subunit
LLFIVAKLSDSSIGAVTRDSLPFIAVMILSLAAITAIPDLVLWLPRQFGYQG